MAQAKKKPKIKGGAEVVPARRATSAGGTAIGEARRLADIVKPHSRVYTCASGLDRKRDSGAGSNNENIDRTGERRS